MIELRWFQKMREGRNSATRELVRYPTGEPVLQCRYLLNKTFARNYIPPAGNPVSLSEGEITTSVIEQWSEWQAVPIVREPLEQGL